MEMSIPRTETQSAPVSNKKVWAGRILSGLVTAFLLFDAGIKFSTMPEVRDSFTSLGYSPAVAPTTGILMLACVVLYVIPRTSLLGAVVLTGYLGGAIATHVRVGNPLFSHVLFPVYVAAFIWGGLLLRDERLRQLFPLRK